MDHGHNRRDFMKVLAGASLAPYLNATSAAMAATNPKSVPEAAKVYLEPFNYDGVRLGDGRLKQQYQVTRDFYFNLPDDDILKGFRQRAKLPAPGNDLGGWNRLDPYEHLGQWMSAMARMHRAAGDEAVLDKAVRLMQGWAETVDLGRYFADCRWPAKPHYAYDKTVQGLIDLYEYGGCKEALLLLEKITDWAIHNLDRSRVIPTPEDRDAKATEWYTLSENLYRAYQLTGDPRYRTFGDVWRYPTYWTTFSTASPLVQGLHGYSHVNTLGSAAMTYAVTGDPVLLQAIVDAYDYFMRTQCFATGGFGPDENLMPADGSLGKSLETVANSFETPCGSWAVFKFARHLMKFTGEARFGDWIEKMVYNGIGAALPMGDGGSTFYYADYRLGAGRKAYHNDAYPCCAGSYPLAVTDYHNIIYFKNPLSLYVNLYIPSEVNWTKDGEHIRVVQQTAYPELDSSSLTIDAKKEVVFSLKFRVPGWSQGAKVTVNGSPLDVVAHPGTWCTVQRTWRSGDRVVIQIPMRLALTPVDQQHPKRVAVTRGPVVLVRKCETTLAVDGDPSKWLVPGDKPGEFRSRLRPTGTFVPYYRLGQDEPYVMYFDREGESS